MSDQLYFGTVVWFNVKKGFGFIAWEKDGVKQKDMFIHYSDISAEGFKTLNKDQKVSFKIGKNRSNVDKATEVTVVK